MICTIYILKSDFSFSDSFKLYQIRSRNLMNVRIIFEIHQCGCRDFSYRLGHNVPSCQTKERTECILSLELQSQGKDIKVKGVEETERERERKREKSC